MDIQDLVVQPVLPAYLELIKVDCTGVVTGNPIYRITPNIKGDLITQVEWGGETYVPYPCIVSGIESTAEGAYPRPTLTISNLDSFFGTLSFLFEDIAGAKVTYIRTFESYINLGLSISAPPQSYFISHTTQHDLKTITWELRHKLDRELMKLPRGVVYRKEFPGVAVNKNL